MNKIDVYFDASYKAPPYAQEDPNFNVVWPGHPDCHLEQNAKDERWIPHAGKAGWIAIHRDEQILKNDEQWDLVRDSKLSMVAIRGAGSEKLEVAHALLRPVWEKLHHYQNEPRPWLIQIIYTEHRPIYNFYDHHRIDRDNWDRKRPLRYIIREHLENQ